MKGEGTLKKQKILEKIVQKDYNNELEEVIENKDFDEEVKNLLLGILYKIDVSYKDYKKIKRNVISKPEYIEKFINIIQENCNIIKIIKPNSELAREIGSRTCCVDNENKKIICYPVERKLLYAISKIGKQEEIINNKYYLINNAMSHLINIGNNINTVEPLRDFNGWSWRTIKQEIENITYNLIYQNLIFLVGEKFLNEWTTNKEYIIDYYEEFKNELLDKFGSELKEKIILALENLSILLELEVNQEFEENMNKFLKENNNELLTFQNNEEFIEKITEEKKQINRELKKIDKMLNNKEMLAKEYLKLNNSPSPYEKIFSIRILEKKINSKKIELLERLEEKNQLLNPKKFIEEKTKLENRNKLLNIVKIKNRESEIAKTLIDFQKLFLQCFIVYINTAETKEQIINLIYILRYYNLLPFNENIDIYQNKELQKKLKEIKQLLIMKAVDYKLINVPSTNIEENIEILHYIFQIRIISIEDIYLSIIEEKDGFFVEFSENNESTYEEKFKIENIIKENLNIKLNKNIKIFV